MLFLSIKRAKPLYNTVQQNFTPFSPIRDLYHHKSDLHRIMLLCNGSCCKSYSLQYLLINSMHVSLRLSGIPENRSGGIQQCPTEDLGSVWCACGDKSVFLLSFLQIFKSFFNVRYHQVFAYFFPTKNRLLSYLY